MAPEQLNAKKYGIDERIAPNLDLWALGVTIYEVVTGKVLFKNSETDSNEEMMANILSPESLDRIDELPQPFREVVRRCLVKDARRRARRAEELIDLLNRPGEVTPQPDVESVPQEQEKVASSELTVAEQRFTVPEEPVEARPAAEIRPEMRLIPDTEPVTQDLFVPEKSWVWAEAVSAPRLEDDEPFALPMMPPGVRIWNDLQRIAIIAVTVLVIIASYIIIQNHRLSQALHSLPLKEDAASMIQSHRPAK
jgi:serine/threonine protein kinase